MNEANIARIKASCKGADIVVASKYIDEKGILEMTQYGLFDFGENRVDAFLNKYESLKDVPGIHFHFIGHLQSNKAKMIANKICCLHSLDSLKLARILNDSLDSPLDCYVELHLTNNNAKSGVTEGDLPAFLEGLKAYDKIHVIGFMAMSDADMSDEEKKKVFAKAKALADQYGYHRTSMGMSDDYLLAIEEGSTLVRLGRILLK